MNINKLSSINYSPIRKNNLNTQNSSFDGKFHIYLPIISPAYSAFTDKLAVKMGKVINSEPIVKFSEKFHNTNIADYVFKATSVVLSSFEVGKILSSDKIEQDRKKTLALNTTLSCAIATIGGFYIDKKLEKPVNKFIKAFKTANPNLNNMNKFVDGIKVFKSALLFGTIYRFVVPVIATMIAEKFISIKDNNQNKNLKVNA